MADEGMEPEPRAHSKPHSRLRPKPEVCVGAVVIDRSRLLLVRRGRGAAIGRWSIPGGRVEPGESLAEATEREVMEETGLAVTCDRFIGWVERISDDYHFVIMDFEAVLPPPTDGDGEGEGDGDATLVAGDDAAAVAWVSMDQLPTYDLVDGLYDFLDEHGVVDSLSE